MTLALFGADSELTAIFRLVATVLWIAAALFSSHKAAKAAGGQTGLVGLGMAFYFFPGTWNALAAAF